MTINKTNNRLNPIPYFVICLITFILFDLIVTNHILHNLYMNNVNLKFLDIVYVQNTGAAFSSFQHSTVLLIIFSVLALLLLVYELFKNLYKYSLSMHFVSAMLSAGIICNTYERVSLGYVRDFISINLFEFPVFNISDILINIGVLAIIVMIITKKYRRDGNKII